MATGVREKRAETLIRLVEDEHEPDAVQFIQAAGAVHVVAHVSDWPSALDKSDYAPLGFDVLAVALGDTWAVCGVRFVRHRGGYEQGARGVSHFPDDLLCQNCHAAFGDMAHLIFDANQPDDEDD